MAKYVVWVLAVSAVVLAASTASAAWVVPGPVVVHSYYPVGPVYAYPAPAPVVVGYPPAVPVVRGPVFAPAPVYVAPAPGVWVGPRGRVRAVVW